MQFWNLRFLIFLIPDNQRKCSSLLSSRDELQQHCALTCSCISDKSACSRLMWSHSAGRTSAMCLCDQDSWRQLLFEHYTDQSQQVQAHETCNKPKCAFISTNPRFWLNEYVKKILKIWLSWLRSAEQNKPLVALPADGLRSWKCFIFKYWITWKIQWSNAKNYIIIWNNQ